MNRTLFNTTVLWRTLAPLWDTPGEGAAAPAAGEPTAGGEGEGSPPAVGAESQSGDTPAPDSLIANGDQPKPADGTSGEGSGLEFTPLTTDDITIPEGIQVDDKSMEDFLGIMNNQELSSVERGQRLVDLQLEITQEAADAATAAGATLWDETQQQWQEQARALPEIGGDKLPETLATIKKGLEHIGAGQATFDALNMTGAGNHPELIKTLHALTKGLVETSPVTGDGAPEGRKLTQAEIMFGASSKQE